MFTIILCVAKINFRVICFLVCYFSTHNGIIKGNSSVLGICKGFFSLCFSNGRLVRCVDCVFKGNFLETKVVFSFFKVSFSGFECYFFSREVSFSGFKVSCSCSQCGCCCCKGFVQSIFFNLPLVFVWVISFLSVFNRTWVFDDCWYTIIKGDFRKTDSTFTVGKNKSQTVSSVCFFDEAVIVFSSVVFVRT